VKNAGVLLSDPAQAELLRWPTVLATSAARLGRLETPSPKTSSPFPRQRRVREEDVPACLRAAVEQR
jgi:hypothetical protein